MNAALAVAVIAALTFLTAEALAPKPQPARHHIYYCIYAPKPIQHPYIPGAYISDPDYGKALPCKWRKNTPVSV